jgi:hypothetical protein
LRQLLGDLDLELLEARHLHLAHEAGDRGLGDFALRCKILDRDRLDVLGRLENPVGDPSQGGVHVGRHPADAAEDALLRLYVHRRSSFFTRRDILAPVRHHSLQAASKEFLFTK